MERRDYRLGRNTTHRVVASTSRSSFSDNESSTRSAITMRELASKYTRGRDKYRDSHHDGQRKKQPVRPKSLPLPLQPPSYEAVHRTTTHNALPEPHIDTPQMEVNGTFPRAVPSTSRQMYPMLPRNPLDVNHDPYYGVNRVSYHDMKRDLNLDIPTVLNQSLMRDYRRNLKEDDCKLLRQGVRYEDRILLREFSNPVNPQQQRHEDTKRSVENWLKTIQPFASISPSSVMNPIELSPESDIQPVQSTLPSTKNASTQTGYPSDFEDDLSDYEMEPLTFTKYCFLCSSKYHLAKRCPERHYQEQVFCYRCGKQGYTMRRCPKCKDSWRREFLEKRGYEPGNT